MAHYLFLLYPENMFLFYQQNITVTQRLLVFIKQKKWNDNNESTSIEQGKHSFLGHISFWKF